MTLSFSRPPLPWPRIGIWFLPILTAGAVIAGHLYSRTIAGPFIFGDESTYFQLARNLAAGGGFSGHTQYGPLYPALISAFFGLPDDSQRTTLIFFDNFFFLHCLYLIPIINTSQLFRWDHCQ